MCNAFSDDIYKDLKIIALKDLYKRSGEELENINEIKVENLPDGCDVEILDRIKARLNGRQDIIEK